MALCPEDAIAIPFGDGELPALGLRPPAARWLYVLAHGAGAGMRHPFLHDIAVALAARDIATLRWEMPYMAAGRRRPDPPGVCEAAARAACAAAAAWAPELRRIAGGKSMGGRMTSQAAAKESLSVAGIVFFGFPLHPAGAAPDTKRAEHLGRTTVPLLFLQGTRDALADPALMRQVAARLGARATVVEIAGADHGFDVLVRSGRTRAEVIDELAGAVAAWVAHV